MKITVVASRFLLLNLAAAALLLPSTFAREHSSATPEDKPATVAEAKAFLDDAEDRLFDLGNKAQRADWVHANFITDDTDQLSADADEAVNTLTVELATKAHRFDSLKLSPETGAQNVAGETLHRLSRAFERRGAERIGANLGIACGRLR